MLFGARATQHRLELTRPTFAQVDLRLDKIFRLGTTRLTVGGTVFNVFNNNVVLSTITRQNQTTANNVTTILAPRVAQFGVKFAF